MKIRPLATVICIVLGMVIFPSFLSAQPGGGGPDPDPSVPIDGGLSLLIAAGVGYAAKKAHDKRKESTGELNKEK